MPAALTVSTEAFFCFWISSPCRLFSSSFRIVDCLFFLALPWSRPASRIGLLWFLLGVWFAIGSIWRSPSVPRCGFAEEVRFSFKFLSLRPVPPLSILCNRACLFWDKHLVGSPTRRSSHVCPFNRSMHSGCWFCELREKCWPLAGVGALLGVGSHCLTGNDMKSHLGGKYASASSHSNKTK